ncbi:MAG TPA: hypothetical protein VK233_03855 [Candidatus Dormibacteraeota bacterium]|nr:hypothetical protein [Candidatus Dormibacteraeota bacterium]
MAELKQLMDAAAIVLPVIAFLALATAFAVILRRAGRLLAATRDVERFRRQVGDLGERIETSLGEISHRVDALRRGQLDAAAISDDLTASLDAVGLYADEARALQPPIDAVRIRTGLISELERASRAIGMIEHGCSIQISARAGARGLEAQTAIKRGYLNVLHAREAIHRHRLEVANLTPAGELRRRVERQPAPTAAAKPTGTERPLDHRM